MRSQRQKRPLLVIREGGLSLFGSHGKGTGPRVSHCIAMRECQNSDASRGQKLSKSKNFQTFFPKHVCSTFQDSGIILSGKKFSEFQTNPSPDIAMRFERQKLPLTCNQRRRTLPVRITWKGDWTSGVSLHCDARVPVEVKNFQSQKIFQLFFSKHVCSTFQDSTLG